ncbi:NAD(P)/FAD-dependent oxidoreductase [Bacillus changyiensis]|uniref:NAD(P)/FAD-dependent oxidoreductase n=1 Tax=Bacillus changyiensis TaxID=3004103 RepID=UPI0022DF4951|nr:NAD(P)/FAD-dependent oxidoreductase [Bacillus changyiensis]MDA1478393.1 NAD(P)/FAD-dependent oxidoreductase [Bacillus changyiensis]
MNMFDCVIVGGGSAGLSASLTLGRARRKIALFDDGTNRNRVTQQSHGYLTRDGTTPQAFKETGLNELKKYPSTSYFHSTITEIVNECRGEYFIVKTSDGQECYAEKLMLATGIQEEFSIPSVREFYGKSLFSCPYCDGWELRDQPIIIIAEKDEHVMHMVKLVYNWTNDVAVLTNGVELSKEYVQKLQKRNIIIKSEYIKNLIGQNGDLQKIEFQSGEIMIRSGGFVVPSYYRPHQFVEQLACQVDKDGTVVTDGAGRTTTRNVYIAGETQKLGATSLIIAAADGQKAAFSVNHDLVMERF